MKSWVYGFGAGRNDGRAEMRNLLGGNASFRRDVFTVAGGFPSHIGRTSAQQRNPDPAQEKREAPAAPTLARDPGGSRHQAGDEAGGSVSPEGSVVLHRAG